MKIIINKRIEVIKRRLTMIFMLFIMINCFTAASVKNAAQTIDTDGDGVPDNRDNCPNTQNPEKIAFTSHRDGDSEIFVVDANGFNQQNLTFNSVFDGDPALSPNGANLAFTSNRDGNMEIYTMSAYGIKPTRLTNHINTDEQPAFSPDGGKIVFRSTRDLNFEIYVMNADGTNQTRLTGNLAEDRDPAFSPDGNKIVFSSNRAGNFEIYVMNADGTNPTRLTDNAAIDDKPAFSPDGTKIVFTSERDGNFEVYLMNADGSNQINLTNNPTYDADPVFSPDGSKIAFHSVVNDSFEILSMNIDGSNRINLTNMAESDLQPSWGGQADSDNNGVGDACENTAPIIEAFDISRQQGTSSVSVIARAFDLNQNPRGMDVKVNGSLSATVNGVTVSEIDTSFFPPGSVRARVSAACEASDASFTLRVTDIGGLFDEDELHVTVLPETTPPVINLNSAAIELFPANHEYSTIEVGQLVESVTDNCTSIAVGAVVIEKITSDESDDAPGEGDGNTVNDILIAADCRSVQLRAERSGNGNGRVYTITLRVRDSAGGGPDSGNTTRVEYKISVPKSRNGPPAIQDAAALTISSGCP